MFPLQRNGAHKIASLKATLIEAKAIQFAVAKTNPDNNVVAVGGLKVMSDVQSNYNTGTAHVSQEFPFHHGTLQIKWTA